MLVRTALSAALALAALPATAYDWHVGVGAAGKLEDRVPTAGERARGDNAGVFVVGVTHPSGFGLEGAYVDLGRLRASGIADAGFDVDGDLWSLGLTYTLGDGPVRPYAKLGWFSRDDSGTANTIAGPRRFKVDDDGATIEVGGRWQFGETFGLRAGYAWYDFDGDAEGSVQVLLEARF